MNREEIIEQQNAYYMAGYPSRRSENKIDKDEMKNKISMALKDLQQGFEIICKENSELKENIKEQGNNEHCQFTKAKEIIKNLIDDFAAIYGNEIIEFKAVKEARQFIKEEVGC